ncbi:hypothetical protein ABPG73_014534 [Tetrahymena malaccensis]
MIQSPPKDIHILDDLAILKSKFVVNKKIDEYEKISKVMIQFFQNFLEVQNTYLNSLQQLLDGQKQDQMADQQINIFSIFQESEFDKDVNIKEFSIKLRKELLDKVEQQKKFCHYIQTGIIGEINQINEQMLDMRASFNRIIDEDIITSRKAFLKDFENEKIPQSQLQNWSDDANSALQCLINNSKSQSKVSCSKLIDIGQRFLKTQTAQKLHQYLEEEQVEQNQMNVLRSSKGISSVVAPYHTHRESYFPSNRKSMYQNIQASREIKERNNTLLKEMLLKSQNVNKIVDQQETFFKENLEENKFKVKSKQNKYGQQKEVNDQKVKIDYNYHQDLIDLITPYTDQLKIKYNQKQFEILLYSLVVFKIQIHDIFDQDDKSSIKELFRELFKITTEQDALIHSISHNQPIDENLLNSSSIKEKDLDSSGSFISSKFKSILNFINIMSNKQQAESLEKGNNILQILLYKIINFSEKDSLIQKNQEFIKDLLQHLIITVALNNQWYCNINYELNSPEFDQSVESFEQFAKIFFCNQIKYEDILLNIKEQQTLLIQTITYPLSFQIIKILMKQLIFPYDPEQQTDFQMLHEHWVDSFELIKSFSDNYLKLSSHTLKIILIYECYTNYIKMFKSVKKFQFLLCFKELTLDFHFDNERGNFQGEQMIQNQLVNEIVFDLKDVCDNIHKYVMLSHSAFPYFCQIYDYLLSFYLLDEKDTKQNYIQQHFVHSGKNLSFELMKISGFVPLKSPSLNVKLPLEKSVSLEAEQNEQIPPDPQQEKITQDENNNSIQKQYTNFQNTSTKNQDQIINNIFLHDKKDNSLTDFENQIQSQDFDDLQQQQPIEGHDKQLTAEKNLKRIYKILNCLHEEKDHIFLFSIYIPEFQRQFDFKQHELILLFVDNLLSDINEQIKILIQNKTDIPKSSYELILYICQELQKFDKITNFIKELSYYEIALPLLDLWLENYKFELANITTRCIQNEKWENQESSANQIYYNSKNSQDFVSILFKSIESLLVLSCPQSFSFTKIINYLLETILLDTCDYYCEIVVSSLSELSKNIQEIQFQPIDKYCEEIIKEDIFQQETNLQVLRSICLRLGNLRFLADQINQNTHLKGQSILEIINDNINFASKKVSEIIGKSFVFIFLKNFFDCYLQNLDSHQLNQQSIKEFSISAFYGIINLLPNYKSYFSLILRRIPKPSFSYIQNIIVDQFEKQMITCFVDINKLELIQNQKKFGLFLQNEIDFCRDYLKSYFQEGFNLSQVYKIAILYQKETSDLIMQISNQNLPEFDHQLAFRIIYMRKKYDQSARNYVTKHQHKFIQKKTFNLKKFLQNI